MIGALPQTPEFIAFVFPKMGRKNRRQKSAAHFGVKSVQPLRSHSCVAVSCRTEKANYIINNCLEDYSIYTVCATLPNCSCIQFMTTYKIAIPTGMSGRAKIFFDCGILHFVSITIIKNNTIMLVRIFVLVADFKALLLAI